MKWILFFLIGCLLINADTSFAQKKNIESGFYHIVNSGGQIMVMQSEHDGVIEARRTYRISKKPFCSIREINSVEIDSSYCYQGMASIKLTLNKKGASIIKEVSKKYINKKIAFVINSKIISMPVFMSEIENGRLDLSGIFSIVQSKKIVQDINNEIKH